MPTGLNLSCLNLPDSPGIICPVEVLWASPKNWVFRKISRAWNQSLAALRPKHSQVTYRCDPTLSFSWFSPHRGLIASGFTETHYLQDGTDVSLTRNYTVSPACSAHWDNMPSDLCVTPVAVGALNKLASQLLPLGPKENVCTTESLSIP